MKVCAVEMCEVKYRDTLIRELFTYVDRLGQPHTKQTQEGGTAEYDVLVPIPATLLRKLREVIA